MRVGDDQHPILSKANYVRRQNADNLRKSKWQLMARSNLSEKIRVKDIINEVFLMLRIMIKL